MNKVNIKIDFFQSDGKMDNRAIGAGVYIVELELLKHSESTNPKIPLYVGQSLYMVKRCGEHLHELVNKPEYFGLNENNIKNETLVLCFRVLDYLPNSNPFTRFKQEKVRIMEKHPRTQGSNSDKQVKNKVEIVQEELRSYGITYNI